MVTTKAGNRVSAFSEPASRCARPPHVVHDEGAEESGHGRFPARQLGYGMRRCVAGARRRATRPTLYLRLHEPESLGTGGLLWREPPSVRSPRTGTLHPWRLRLNPELGLRACSRRAACQDETVLFSTRRGIARSGSFGLANTRQTRPGYFLPCRLRPAGPHSAGPD